MLHGILFCCFISGRLHIFELFSFIFIRVLRPSPIEVACYMINVLYSFERGTELEYKRFSFRIHALGEQYFGSGFGEKCFFSFFLVSCQDTNVKI